MPIKDPEKRREYNRRYYHQKDKPQQQQRVRRRKAILKGDFDKWKATKSCLHCGESDPICLEFHHVDPATKDTEPSLMVGVKGWPVKRIITYLETYCLCLCSNCHKKIHRELRELQKKLARPPARKTHRILKVIGRVPSDKA